jgi:hypothetical protein
MGDCCYLCGKPATKPLKLKDSFTAHSVARIPTSDKMCDRCDWSINLRCFYFNPNKQKWGKLFSRNWSWLFQRDKLIAPKIEETHTEGKDTLEIVSELPTRAQLREWLLNPPEPPFTLAIAESGQKHILFLAQEAHNRDIFPVQFELDTLHLDRKKFTALVQNYEALMALDFSKSEIDSGDYRSDRLLKSFEQWESLEKQIAFFRGSRLFQLVSFVAVK